MREDDAMIHRLRNVDDQAVCHREQNAEKLFKKLLNFKVYYKK